MLFFTTLGHAFILSVSVNSLATLATVAVSALLALALGHANPKQSGSGWIEFVTAIALCAFVTVPGFMFDHLQTESPAVGLMTVILFITYCTVTFFACALTVKRSPVRVFIRAYRIAHD